MFRMPVEYYADEELFTKESLEFLKDEYDDNVYNLIVNNIQDSQFIEIEVWPGAFEGREWLRPEFVFASMVNHFKSDGLTVIVRADQDKFNPVDYGIPEEYVDVYYRYTLNIEDYGKEEIDNGEFALEFDGDYAYAYDPDNDEEIKVIDIEDADFIELY